MFSNFMQSSLFFNVWPRKLHLIFITGNINDEVHHHRTTSNVVIVRENYFETGTVSQAKILHTRQSNLVNYGGKSMQVLGPTLWNNLPCELRNMEIINPFKYHCKNHYIDPYGQISSQNRNSNRNSDIQDFLSIRRSQIKIG